MIKLYVDGGCFGNSQKDLSKRKMIWVVIDKDKKVFIEEESDGGSNNIAEFLAIKTAIKYCVEHEIKNVTIYSDSNCAISWYNNKIKGKNLNDKDRVLEIKKEIKSLVNYFDTIKIKLIPREKNLAGIYIENKK